MRILVINPNTSEEMTGVFTGSYAIHPATGARIPIWTGDYVLAGYGTGAVMGVPARVVHGAKANRPRDAPGG